MKCPHCTQGIQENWSIQFIVADTDGAWFLRHMRCPECRLAIVVLDQYADEFANKGTHQPRGNRLSVAFARPRAASRPHASPYVPTPLANDYNEACLVLDLSPKASAALSRRCLQAVLREQAKVKEGRLYDEIEEAIHSGKLPSYISDNLHDLRELGNLAAHPEKNERSGEILDVEPGEAEWFLETLEALFDFYYVAPAKNKEKRTAVHAKLAERKGAPKP